VGLGLGGERGLGAHRLAVVGAEAAVLEVGAVMSRMSCPLVAVLDRRLSVLGVASWE
jgi:hypothetical protein